MFFQNGLLQALRCHLYQGVSPPFNPRFVGDSYGERLRVIKVGCFVWVAIVFFRGIDDPKNHGWNTKTVGHSGFFLAGTCKGNLFGKGKSSEPNLHFCGFHVNFQNCKGNMPIIIDLSRVETCFYVQLMDFSCIFFSII